LLVPYNNESSIYLDIKSDKEIKTFGKKGHQAAQQEMKQLHNCIIFKPILIEDLLTMKKKTLNSLIFLTEQKNRRIKARVCTYESTQQDLHKLQ
jgi:hypothetical protein